MKKFILLLALFATICSCDDKPIQEQPEEDSLADTHWKLYGIYKGEWMQDELFFTSTHATYLYTDSRGGHSTFTGTYTYDPDSGKVVIVEELGPPPPGSGEYPSEQLHEGTVEGDILTISIVSLDVIAKLTLRKQ